MCVIATFAAEQVSYSSIKGYLSPLRHLQIYRLGYDPNICDMAGLHFILQGIKRSQAISGRGSSPRTHLPITTSTMRLLKHCWEAGGASFYKAML